MPALPGLLTLAFDPSVAVGDLRVRWEAVALTAVLLLALVLWVRAVRAHTPGPVAGLDVALVLAAAVVGAAVGGRVVHALDFLDVYAADPLAALDLGRGSSSLVGAVLGGMAAAGCLSRLLGVPTGVWADAAAVPLLVAIGGGKLALVLGGAGQGAPWDASWALAYAGPGPWRVLEPGVAAWPSQALEGAWTLLGIPVVVVTRRLLADGRYDGRGLLLTLALAWWLVGRVVVATTWRDTPIVGPLGPEGVATLIALALGLLATALFLVTATRRPAAVS